MTWSGLEKRGESRTSVRLLQHAVTAVPITYTNGGHEQTIEKLNSGKDERSGELSVSVV